MSDESQSANPGQEVHPIEGSGKKPMKVLFIYEWLFPPYDEGVKKFAFMVHSAIVKEHKTRIIREFRWAPRLLNGILLVPRALITALIWRPDRVVYIPKGALTLAGFVKSWLLEKLTNVQLSVVNVQKRQLGERSANLIRRMRLRNLFVFSQSMVAEMQQLGQESRVIMAGIDRETFSPTKDSGRLRKKYNIPADRQVLLHVGHIRQSRNIAWLGEVQTRIPDIQVVLVGSTATRQEHQLVGELEGKGVIVIRDALPDIQEVYQLSNWYCFPVEEEDAAMEIPLSVLEAMSTNLPVATTRFGQLPEIFEEDLCFRFVDGVDELVAEIARGKENTECNNREKTQVFSWQHTANTLLAEKQ